MSGTRRDAGGEKVQNEREREAPQTIKTPLLSPDASEPTTDIETMNRAVGRARKRLLSQDPRYNRARRNQLFIRRRVLAKGETTYNVSKRQYI